MSRNGDKKYLKKLKNTKYLSPRLKSQYVEKLENEIEQRQLKREKETQDRLAGLLLEREILKIHLAGVLPD
ncbi:MAG: hypothetical protein AB3N18_11130 [Allomuricauda sp.]